MAVGTGTGVEIRFVRDAGARECSAGERAKFRKGAIVVVSRESAERWAKRGAAETHEPKARKARQSDTNTSEKQK